jgi:PAS domain S-box-containing protein
MSILKNIKSSNSAIDFEELFNSAHDAILIIHPKDEIILEVNKSALEIFGYTRKDFIGMKLLDISKNIEFERKKINEILTNKSINNFETFRYTLSKKEICLYVNASIIRYKDENVILQFCRDITQKNAFESALMASESKYRALYENYPFIHITINTDKKITSINKNGASNLGYNIEELINSDLSLLFAPQEVPKLDKQIATVLQNPDTPYTYEIKMFTLNKEEFWVRETIYSSTDKKFNPQIFLVCDNINSQKNAEVDAKNLAQSLQNMLDASPLGVLVYRLDENDELILISTNQSAVDILQIDLYALISKKIQEIFPGLVGEGLLEKYRAVISTGHSLRNQNIVYKDEHFYGIYEYSAIRLTTNTVAVFFTDITEKHKALTALTESEKKYKTLFNSANDAIFLMKDDKFIDCNIKTAEIFGGRKEDIIGRSPQELSPEFQPDGSLSSESALSKINLALKDKPQFFEWTHKKFDGSLFLVEVGLNKIEFHKDIYIQAIVRDITKRKESEKIIADRRRELSNLMSNLPGMAYRCENNINWTMQFVSEGCYDLTGYKPEDLLNDKVISYSNIIHKDDRLSVNEKVQKAVEIKEPFTLLYRIITSTGELKWVWEKGRGVFDEWGNLIYLEGFITDITERKSSEEKIKILAHALTSVTECVCITDLRDRINFINKSFSRVYGYSQQELIGKHISIIRSDKNDPEMVRKILPETLAGGWTGDLINLRKGGEEFPIHLSTSLVLNEDGHPIAITGIIVDISERIRQEKNHN